jgi:hypothetical protein
MLFIEVQGLDVVVRICVLVTKERNERTWTVLDLDCTHLDVVMNGQC